MPNLFQANGLPNTRRGLSNPALGIPPAAVNLIMQQEDSRKRGWAAFFAEVDVNVNNWRQNGVRREVLVNTHRQVQSTTAGTHSAPVHFLKVILRGFEAMIAKWGPGTPELKAQIDAMEAHHKDMEAKKADLDAVDPPDQATLDAVEASIAALKKLQPEQEREECVICLEEIEAGQVFDKDQGVLFAPKCMHAMHDNCAKGYFNAAKDGGLPAGANGLPNAGKGIACPAKCGAYYHLEYVVNMRKAKTQVIEDRGKEAQKAAQAAERAVKRKADALDAGIDSDEDAQEDALVPMPEGNGAGFVPLTEKPPLGDPLIVQNWLDRKAEAGHIRYLTVHDDHGVPYQFVLGGTENTYPLMNYIRAAGYNRFSDKAPKFDVGKRRSGAPEKAWGKPIPPSAPAGEASGSGSA